MQIQVYSVDREKPDEEILKETLKLDLSPLLFEKNNDAKLEWSFDKMQTLELLYLNISLQSDVPLLNSFQRRKLNPLLVTLVACKDVPYHTEPQYKPIFSYFDFVDGRRFRTMDVP